MINARSETAHTLPAFRDAMKLRRCLVPADAFYEWKRTVSTKQPFCFEVNDGELFAFAGLWDRWKDPNGQWIRSCSILTTTPNAVTSVVHDRMPVILNKQDYDLWLDPGMNNVEVLADLLKPYDASLMRSYPVSNRVNQVQNDDENCSKPIELESPTQGRLFHSEGIEQSGSSVTSITHFSGGGKSYGGSESRKRQLFRTRREEDVNESKSGFARSIRQRGRHRHSRRTGCLDRRSVEAVRRYCPTRCSRTA